MHRAEERAESHGHGKHKNNTFKTLLAAIIIVVALLVVLVAGLLVYRSASGAKVEQSQYQAVFLTNGQVYFGNLHSLEGEYVKLTDIYYLQDQSASGGAQNPQDENANDVQLIKLGSEIHGPEDEMFINQDKILFFENLKAKGNVASSIKQYRSQAQ